MSYKKKNTLKIDKYNVLVVYGREQKNIRKTIEDSIFCFGKYSPDNINIFYYSYRSDINFDTILTRINFDIIIFHSILMCYRWHWTKKEWEKNINRIRQFSKGSVKAVFVQDENRYTNKVIQFINSVGIDIIFTAANLNTAKVLYPEDRVKVKKIEQVLTGYVDSCTFNTVKKIANKEKIKRDIDIGYRADTTPFSLGFQGRLKTLIPEIVNKKLEDYPDLKTDICNTYGDKNTFYGMDWFRFMLRCRTMISCMGGSSLHDPDGKIEKGVNDYLKKKRKATYVDVNKDILQIYASPLDYTAISPRCFEAAMAKTCQILIEGDYAGIFKPNVHYIELKKDFSNLDEVLSKVKDKKLCEKIAQHAYKDIIQSGKYTYENYVQHIFEVILPFVKKKQKIKKIQMIFINILLKVNNYLVDNRIIVSDT